MEGICQVGAWWMARRLPHGRTMGYGCPPPLAGGGVPPSNADTRVITALLGTATEGGKQRRAVRAERWGMLYAHTWTSLQAAFQTVLFSTRLLGAQTNGQTPGGIMRSVCWSVEWLIQRRPLLATHEDVTHHMLINTLKYITKYVCFYCFVLVILLLLKKTTKKDFLFGCCFLCPSIFKFAVS